MRASYDANGSPVEGPHDDFQAPPRPKKGVGQYLEGFSHLGTHPFPVHLCVLPDPREKNVYLSAETDYHVVVLVDRRFPDHATMRVMRPYMVEPAIEGGRAFGWLDRSENVASHGERPVLIENAKVVAWRPCPREEDFRA